MQPVELLPCEELPVVHPGELGPVHRPVAPHTIHPHMRVEESSNPTVAISAVIKVCQIPSVDGSGE
jgi:hypothetical protein